MASTSHLCGHLNRTRGRSPTCRRRVLAPDYCYQHRIPAPREVSPAESVTTSSASSQRVARQLRWRGLEGRRSAVLGGDLDGRSRRAGTGLCRELARLAARLDRGVGAAQDALVDAIAGRSGSTLVRLVARRLLEQVSSDVTDPVAVLCRGLRVCGVLQCVVAGDDLALCPCFNALRAEATNELRGAVSEAAVQQLVEDGLAPFDPERA